jgi:hypothetical protein
MNPTADPAQTTSSSDSNCTLRCLVEGDSAPFVVDVEADGEIGALKKTIRDERKHGVFRDVDGPDLKLFKVSY